MNIHETTTQVKNRASLDSQNPQEPPMLTYVVKKFLLFSIYVFLNNIILLCFVLLSLAPT